jgi:hypothetical protein
MSTGLGSHESWGAGGTAQPNEPFAPLWSITPSSNNWELYGLFGGAGAFGGDASAGYALEARNSGVFWVSVCGTFYSTDAPDNTSIGVYLYKRAKGGGLASTSYGGWRHQTVDEIHEPYQSVEGPLVYSAENISFAGPLELAQGDQIQLNNTTGSYAVVGSSIVIAAHRLG